MEELQRATAAAFDREALVGHADPPRARLVSAFFDLSTYKALRNRGASPNRAVEMAVQAAACLVERDQ